MPSVVVRIPSSRRRQKSGLASGAFQPIREPRRIVAISCSAGGTRHSRAFKHFKQDVFTDVKPPTARWMATVSPLVTWRMQRTRGSVSAPVLSVMVVGMVAPLLARLGRLGAEPRWLLSVSVVTGARLELAGRQRRADEGYAAAADAIGSASRRSSWSISRSRRRIGGPYLVFRRGRGGEIAAPGGVVPGLAIMHSDLGRMAARRLGLAGADHGEFEVEQRAAALGDAGAQAPPVEA